MVWGDVCVLVINTSSALDIQQAVFYKRSNVGNVFVEQRWYANGKHTISLFPFSLVYVVVVATVVVVILLL